MPRRATPAAVPEAHASPAPLPPGLRLRDATPDDAEALHALLHAAYAPGQDPHRTRPLKDTLDDVRNYLSEHAVMVIEDEKTGRLLATIHLRSLVNLRRLAVSPDAKGLKLGSLLLDAALARAAAEGFDYAELGTQDDHPWLPEFYRRHGFAERCHEVMPDGTRWMQMRARLR